MNLALLHWSFPTVPQGKFYHVLLIKTVRNVSQGCTLAIENMHFGLMCLTQHQHSKHWDILCDSEKKWSIANFGQWEEKGSLGAGGGGDGGIERHQGRRGCVVV